MLPMLTLLATVIVDVEHPEQLVAAYSLSRRLGEEWSAVLGLRLFRYPPEDPFAPELFEHLHDRHQLYFNLTRMTIKYDALRITFVSTIVESNAAVAMAERVERIGKELGLDAKVTGKMLLYQGMNGHVVDSFMGRSARRCC